MENSRAQVIPLSCRKERSVFQFQARARVRRRGGREGMGRERGQ
jgi:hypothetical protein